DHPIIEIAKLNHCGIRIKWSTFQLAKFTIFYYLVSFFDYHFSKCGNILGLILTFGEKLFYNVG
ncbi:MAG TPA: hypothetical protein VEP90_01410, partial [Methylomirabilota bacterium]|nr:hypothetical protein [Methylomirabilota bacterium]